MRLNLSLSALDLPRSWLAKVGFPADKKKSVRPTCFPFFLLSGLLLSICFDAMAVFFSTCVWDCDLDFF